VKLGYITHTLSWAFRLIRPHSVTETSTILHAIRIQCWAYVCQQLRRSSRHWPIMHCC